MSDDRRTSLGHSPGRAIPRLRVPDLPRVFQALAFRRRRKTAGRFQGPYDWRRMFALGVILIDLAVLALANSVLGRIIAGYCPGMASIFGGLLLAIIIIRLGRPALYFDWIANGLLHIGLGLLLTKDPFLLSWSSFLLFSILLAGSALLMTWIGMTLDIPGGRAWLMAGGLASLICVAWLVVERLTVTFVEPDVVLGVVLLLLGLSIAGLGLSLKRRAE